MSNMSNINLKIGKNPFLCIEAALEDTTKIPYWQARDYEKT